MKTPTFVFRALPTVLKLATFLCVVPMAGQAADFLYTVTNNTVTIKRYIGPGGAVIIPGEIEGLPVTVIARDAFWYVTTPTHVTIPDSVTRIEEFAFSNRNLTGVTFGNGLTSIGMSAFYSCLNLTSAIIPDSVTAIGAYAFQYCRNLSSVHLPASLTVIRESTFYGCVQLTSLTIPDGVVLIEPNAFLGCSALTELSLGNSVTTIGAWAFAECPGLNHVSIPESVTRIDDRAFYYCSGLTNVMISRNVARIGSQAFTMSGMLDAIIVEAANPYYSSVEGVLFDKGQSILIQYPGHRAGHYVIPGTVTNVASFAFRECNWLSGVTIPNSVTTIQNHAFFSCLRLASVTLGENVAFLRDSAFAFCPVLRKVFFKGNPPWFEPSVFTGTDYATVYYLPSATGWGPTYGGRPTMLWNPEVQTNDAGFGVRSNGFAFTIIGTANIPIMVEASTDLGTGAYMPLLTGTLTNGSLYFLDPTWSTYSARFYRIRFP